MRPWSLAALIVVTLALVNGMAYRARHGARVHAAPAPAAVADGALAPDAGCALQPVPAVALAPSPAATPTPDTRSIDAGLLLVTTTPRGILVEVDGEGRDLTPVRLELSPGHHQVVLKEGARVLADESVEIRSGSAAVIVHALDAPPPPEPVEAPVAAVQPQQAE